MSKKQSSLIIKFGLLVGIVMSLVFITLTTIIAVRSFSDGAANFKNESTSESHLLAYALSPQVHNFDNETAEAVANKFLLTDHNMKVKITTEKGEVFLDKEKGQVPKDATVIKVDLEMSGTKLGVLETYHDEHMWRAEVMNSILLQIAFNVGGLLVLLVVLTLLLRSLIFKPLKALGDVAKDIAEGEGDLTKRIPVTSRDELGSLSKNFNQFLDKMKNLANEIKDSLKNTLVIKDNLFSSTQETSSALTEITSNLVGMKKQIQNLDQQILSAGSAVEQISANISSMGTLIDKQSQSVADSTSAVNEMVASINSVAAITETKRRSTEKLLNVTKAGGEKLKQTTQTVTEIAGNLGSISNLIKIINSIAAQTNLLAMNAAIEAAHAGDAGRGFSVVADEIRKLAEGSSVNAKNIGTIIKTIVQKISEASAYATETGQAFEVLSQEVEDVSSAFAEIAASTQELSTGGSQIIQSMTQLSDISSSVRSGSDEMESGAKSMATDMQAVRRISSEVLSGMGEIEAGTKGIAHAVEAIHTQAQELNTSTEKLNKEVSQFKTESQ